MVERFIPTPRTVDQHVGLRMKELRAQKAQSDKNFEPDAFAATVGITTVELAEFESGTKRPDGLTTAKIAQALGVNVTDFFRDYKPYHHDNDNDRTDV